MKIDIVGRKFGRHVITQRDVQHIRTKCTCTSTNIGIQAAKQHGNLFESSRIDLPFWVKKIWFPEDLFELHFHVEFDICSSPPTSRAYTTASLIWDSAILKLRRGHCDQ